MLMVIFISVFDYRWVVECEYLFNIKQYIQILVLILLF